MLHLEKLEISGFKSFYDPAEMIFPAALTAVVGPNGCGKSNICDAIIWVLGEHRASHIRGGTMEDVIFQGSERRRPLGMGEVTLTLATDNGHPVAENGRIVINRRVFRSGESEFRLNGKRVRFKDIADILMDTGLGMRNYSVMEQGKIDMILSNKPQDRRRVLEEAAGITKYKTKRRAAEIKLEETQANLLRIDDTLAEVSRSVNSLKRQASKARRHKELLEELSTAKRSLYAGRVRMARLEQDGSEQGVADARASESEAAAALGQREAELAETRRLLTDRSSYASSIRENLARLGSEVDRLRSFLGQSEANVDDLTARAENARAQIAALEAEAAEQEALLGDKTRAFEAAAAERNRLREVADELERVRQEQGDRVRSHETSIAGSREGLMRTIARISEARNQVHQLEIAVEKCEFYLGKLNDSARKAAQNRDAARQRADQAERILRDVEQTLVQVQQQARDAVERREQLGAHRDTIRESLSSSRDLISQTTFQLDSLRTLLLGLESQDEEVRATILELSPDAPSAAEQVRAAEGYEAALDALLRDITRAVVVPKASIAAEVIARLHQRGAGRAAFIALDIPGGPQQVSSTQRLIEGEGRIADAIRAAMPDAVVVESLDAAIASAKLQPARVFVTRNGDIVRGPLVYGGSKESARGVFSVKRQIRDLEAVLAEAESRVVAVASELQSVEEDLRAAEDARILAEERVKQAELELRDKAGVRDGLHSELERFEKDLSAATEEHSLYLDEKAQLLTRRDDAIENLRALESAEQSAQKSIRDTEEALRAARAEFESATDLASRARVELETGIGNVNAMQREHENLSRIAGSLHSRIAHLLQDITSIAEKQDITESDVARARQELEQTLGSLHQASEERITVEAEVADLEKVLGELGTGAAAARQSWNAGRETLFEAERRRDRANASFELLREQIALDLHTGIESLAEVEPPADEPTRLSLEEEVSRLTEQIERVGPVNVLAIEEYQELEQREQFLRTQRDDLVQAIESLRSTIRKINITSREMFRDAFTTINQYFGEIFRALFGGGQAGMQLLDEEDVLESGIELIAQPPGKKTHSISLLSGGERALTALALLFAIFRYKPSPFCILDEVDAPLDEVNNERFVRLLREMSRDTQFVVITHSKRTMEAADVLFGVTMEEAGCSRLVSVNFAAIEGAA
jgi:chromosome segregation protein